MGPSLHLIGLPIYTVGSNMEENTGANPLEWPIPTSWMESAVFFRWRSLLSWRQQNWLNSGRWKNQIWLFRHKIWFNLVDRLWKMCTLMTRLCWVSGHCYIEWNEKANELAKRTRSHLTIALELSFREKVKSWWYNDSRCKVSKFVPVLPTKYEKIKVSDNYRKDWTPIITLSCFITS